jgi:DNA-binding MarR family transcriptional regulator
MRIYTHVKGWSIAVSADTEPSPEFCNCLALRQASRHISQFYDQHLASAGLRTTQFSILAKLKRLGPLTINALAAAMVMDRTTLGRNILPLQREGLIAVKTGGADRRRKELHLTDKGLGRLRAGRKGWAEAQAKFEAVFGGERASGLRALLREITASDLGIAA